VRSGGDSGCGFLEGVCVNYLSAYRSDIAARKLWANRSRPKNKGLIACGPSDFDLHGRKSATNSADFLMETYFNDFILEHPNPCF